MRKQRFRQHDVVLRRYVDSRLLTKLIDQAIQTARATRSDCGGIAGASRSLSDWVHGASDGVLGGSGVDGGCMKPCCHRSLGSATGGQEHGHEEVACTPQNRKSDMLILQQLWVAIGIRFRIVLQATFDPAECSW